MNSDKIFIIAYFLTVAIILFIYRREFFTKTDNFIAFPRINSVPLLHFRFKFLTPLKPLLSPYKTFDVTVIDIPKLFVFKPSLLSPVRDQGSQCGACWALITTSMLSDNITYRIINFGKNLNAQQLFSCYDKVTGCQGAYPEEVLNWVADTQFQIDISNDYLGRQTECKNIEKGFTVLKNSVRSLNRFFPQINLNPNKIPPEIAPILERNIINMKLQIMEGGPIFASFKIYSNFLNFDGSEIYTKGPGESIGAHAVEIVGWVDKGVDITPGFTEYGYWLCKNSFGTIWARGSPFKGYFAMRMGTNECGIETYAGCATPNVGFEPVAGSTRSHLIYLDYNEYKRS